MHLYTSGPVLDSTLNQLIRNSNRIEIAVAWASSEAPCYASLLKNKGKLSRMIVGIHFYQTDPRVLRDLHRHQNVRFQLQSSGTFHPKIYWFHHGQHRWDCLVGSANLTASAFAHNSECCVHFNEQDDPAGTIRAQLEETFGSYWQSARPLNKEDVARYQERQSQMQAHLGRLSDRQGSIGRRNHKVKPVADSPVMAMSWLQYLAKVNKQKIYLKDRLQVLAEAKAILHKRFSFIKCTLEERQKIAGTVTRGGDHEAFLWFGSMLGAGRFKRAINQNSSHLAKALDFLPVKGPILHHDYVAFLKAFRRAFPKGGGGVAVASRLLAMTRPDYFVCLDNANRRRLAQDFGIKENVSLEEYWTEIVARITASTWWNTPRPTKPLDAVVWDGRAALLDSLYY